MDNAPPRKPYPTDVTNEQRAIVASDLILMDYDALMRRHDLREVVNALGWTVRAGARWHLVPINLPLRRGMTNGCSNPSAARSSWPWPA